VTRAKSEIERMVGDGEKVMDDSVAGPVMLFDRSIGRSLNRLETGEEKKGREGQVMMVVLPDRFAKGYSHPVQPPPWLQLHTMPGTSPPLPPFSPFPQLLLSRQEPDTDDCAK
jgi:hypothetical protein